MKLTVSKSEGDWLVIERAQHDGRHWLESIGPGSMALRCSSRFSDADVEGTAAEMLTLADAIANRSSASFKRCAVRIEGDKALFHSPRNSMQDGVCSLAEADELVVEIRKVCS